MAGPRAPLSSPFCDRYLWDLEQALGKGGDHAHYTLGELTDLPEIKLSVLGQLQHGCLISVEYLVKLEEAEANCQSVVDSLHTHSFVL